MDNDSGVSSLDLGDTPSVKSSNDNFKINEMYSMKNKVRNLAIVFCHKTFSSIGIKKRIGVEADRDRLKSVLKGLNFEVNIYQDKEAHEIMSILKTASKMDDSDIDCLLIAIMSHGGPNTIRAHDVSYEVSELLNKFSEKNCPSLKGKPKLFLLQACRGQNVDCGIDLLRQENTSSYCTSSYAIPFSNFIPSPPPLSPQPTEENLFLQLNERDFLIGYSTIPGYVSYKNETGSWFIQEICSILEQCGRKYDLLTLLTIVSQKVAIDHVSTNTQNLEHDDKKQTPCIISSLTKKLYFFPESMENVPDN